MHVRTHLAQPHAGVECREAFAALKERCSEPYRVAATGIPVVENDESGSRGGAIHQSTHGGHGGLETGARFEIHAAQGIAGSLALVRQLRTAGHQLPHPECMPATCGMQQAERGEHEVCGQLGSAYKKHADAFKVRRERRYPRWWGWRRRH